MPPPPARPWVLLRHDLPDGSWHYDWMLSSDPAAGFVTFRVTLRPDEVATLRFDAERIGEHRRDYLTLEGPLSHDRGTVRRIAAGTCRVRTDDAIFVVELVEAAARWIGTRAAFESPMYRFERDGSART